MPTWPWNWDWTWCKEPVASPSIRPIDPPDGLAALREINEPHPANPLVNPADPNDKRRVLTRNDPVAYKALGYGKKWYEKWAILTGVFVVQLSMNFNAAAYGNAGEGMKEKFGVSQSQVKLGQMLFLVMYAFGCELWAPWSEELGRKYVMQGSLLFVNAWQVGCALAPNFATILTCRALGGLSSAGGSVTLGIVSDLYEPEEQHYAVLYVVLSSVAGSVIGPIAGGFIQTYLTWYWVFWVQLIFGLVAQAVHCGLVPETREHCLLDEEAQRRRKAGEDPKIYGPNEIRGSFSKRTDFKQMLALMWRPYKLLATEPVILFLCLLSGFSDALIFIGLDSFPLVLGQFNFTVIEIGLSFISLLAGYIIAYISFLVVYGYEGRQKKKGKQYTPERRLWWLLWLVPLEPIGLALFGYAAFGPPKVHWWVAMLGAAFIGIANFAIYMATIDYMIAAYHPVAASATGGNGFCRDFLAGLAALFTGPFYKEIRPGTKWQFSSPTFILCGIGTLLCVPVFVFYFFGEWFRNRSPYATQIEKEREEDREAREHAIIESRKVTPKSTPAASRASSPARAGRVDRGGRIMEMMRLRPKKEPIDIGIEELEI
ncbi:uncharacterized protein LTR77_001088 [Saxophila tyrrhenica]|uniref:Major facilitator superfamily (MFS) profile domain-containing protein n=1 Tax=Saxophila tyrrhenica TaxID=1690608 RepID=A0AAV9PLV5_9PEZI|nr:hypothetical protein LTR77_001088 [Saxophila tyrrhenica]